MIHIEHNNFVIDISFDEDDSTEPENFFISELSDAMQDNFNKKMIDYSLKRVSVFFKNYLNSFNNLPPTNLIIYIDTHEDNNWLEEENLQLQVKIVSYFSSLYNDRHCIAPLFHFK